MTAQDGGRRDRNPGCACLVMPSPDRDGTGWLVHGNSDVTSARNDSIAITNALPSGTGVKDELLRDPAKS